MRSDGFLGTLALGTFALVVVLPVAGVVSGYEVAGDTDIGDLNVFGDTEDGFGNEVEARSNDTFAATVVIDLNVDIGYGRVGQD